MFMQESIAKEALFPSACVRRQQQGQTGQANRHRPSRLLIPSRMRQKPLAAQEQEEPLEVQASKQHCGFRQ